MALFSTFILSNIDLSLLFHYRFPTNPIIQLEFSNLFKIRSLNVQTKSSTNIYAIFDERGVTVAIKFSGPKLWNRITSDIKIVSRLNCLKKDETLFNSKQLITINSNLTTILTYHSWSVDVETLESLLNFKFKTILFFKYLHSKQEILSEHCGQELR